MSESLASYVIYKQSTEGAEIRIHRTGLYNSTARPAGAAATCL
jgi:hypothetical protein